MGGFSGESLSYETPSIDSSETLFSERLDKGENLIKKPMHPTVLDEAYMEGFGPGEVFSFRKN